jgi:hypothetical protein
VETSLVGFSEETKTKKVTGSDRTLALGAPMCPVSSDRGACEGLQRANAGCGTPVCPVHGRATAGADHRTCVVNVRC